MKFNSKPQIVVCIPAYEEEKNIAKIVLKAKKYVDEVVVCDDGSQDMTARIAEALGAFVVKHQKNMGYGAALQTLFHEAKKRNPDVVVTLDADGQHDPDEIPKLTHVILKDEADVVVGSRFLGKTNIPWWRKFGVKIITLLARKKIKFSNLTDAQSGFRAYSKKAIQFVMPQDRGMGASVDILNQAQKHGLKIVEVPITIYYHEESSTQNPVKHGADVVSRIIQLVVEENPLRYLGIPGLILIFTGIVFGAYLFWLFNLTRYFSIPIAIITLGTSIVGLTLTIAALILYAIKRIAEKD